MTRPIPHVSHPGTASTEAWAPAACLDGMPVQGPIAQLAHKGARVTFTDTCKTHGPTCDLRTHVCTKALIAPSRPTARQATPTKPARIDIFLDQDRRTVL